MDIFEQLTSLSPKLLLPLLLCVLGWRLKRSPILPNVAIPYVLMALGGGVYPIIAAAADVDYTAQLVVTNIIIGALEGLVAVGLHATLKPIFPFLFRDGDTQMIEKKKETEE